MTFNRRRSDGMPSYSPIKPQPKPDKEAMLVRKLVRGTATEKDKKRLREILDKKK